jgi:hypothetical protein
MKFKQRPKIHHPAGEIERHVEGLLQQRFNEAAPDQGRKSNTKAKGDNAAAG